MPLFLLMNKKTPLSFIFLLLAFAGAYAQLGFCPGSKGEPLFTENFGNGTTYGPALPAGVTTYAFVTGAPQDGQYTVHNNSYQYTTWHNSLDHTPDATNGPNGKMLLMNANAVTSGDFYKKTVTGLCVNTTFEFSAWVMNVYNPNSNYCGAGQIPINVRFEIWNAAETILLGSGNTGNIFGTPTPLWQQFALVFTTVSETSVVLKMKNNGVGGCGNDLAIDDISFSACGEVTTVSSPSVTGDTFTTCTNPVSLQLQAATASAVPHFYQWQTSSDGVSWTDVVGATAFNYTTPNISSLTYYRVKAAQDAANLANVFCSTASNVFTISVLSSPGAAVSNGDATICSDETIPALSVVGQPQTSVSWYSAATGGTLLQANSTSYTPTAPGIFYAEMYNVVTGCIASPRTPVQLSVVPLPDVTISGTTTICGGNTAVISFTGTPNATVTFSDGTTNQTVTLNAAGSASFTTPVLTATTTYTLLDVASGALGTCVRTKSDSVTVTVNNSATASIAIVSSVCAGSAATLNFTGTPNATVTYSDGSGNQTVNLNASGTASVVFPNITATATFTLVQVSVGGVCTQSLSQSVTVNVVTSPTASINANPSSVCENQTSTIAFTGTPNAVVTYKINEGGNQTATLNASGLASFTTSPLVSNSTFTLISVALGACSNTINTTATVSVNGLPTASIASNSPVCSGNPATITFTGTPNATVNYTAGTTAQSVTLNASGTASVTIPNVTSPTVYTLTGVTSSGVGGCSQALSQSVNVSAVTLPTASIAASASSVCANQTATLTFTGTPNAVITYNDGIGSQTVALNTSGNATVTTSPLTAGVTYQLISVASSGCSRPLSDFVSIAISPAPTVNYTGDLVYCEGENISIALSGTAGATFNWTATQNGASGATSGNGNQIDDAITLTGNAAGTITYTVTPSFNGCVGNPVVFTVAVHPLPVPQIQDGVICTSSMAAPSTQFYTLDTGLNPAIHSFQWFFGTSPIPGALGSSYNATQTGSYTVIATSTAGCESAPVTAVVGEMPQGESLLIEQSEAFADQPRIVVNVVGGGGPFLYALDNGPFQSSNVFVGVPPGMHTVTVIDDYCTDLSASVTLINYPKFFTPNADGFNDSWNIDGVDAIIWIFDRYGKLLKQIGTGGSGWDGTYNGQPMPSSDYWFAIDYTENGARKTFRAHFALKR